MYERILVAIDISDEAEKVLSRAKVFADKFAAKISLIHVVEPVLIDSQFDITPIIDVDVEKSLVQRANSFLAEMVNKLGMSIDEITVPVGSTKAEIHSKASQMNAALIMIGTHGRHGFARLLGSTANAVLHGAPCDVLSVKMSEKD